MTDLKEKVDKYLKDNHQVIEELRESKLLRWFEIAVDFATKEGYKKFSNKDGKLTLRPEYFRSRYAKFREKQDKKIINTVSKTNLVDFKYTSGKEDKKEGSKEFTFTSDKIPTEQEIIEHFNIDTKKYKINQIYHKTSFGGKYAITVSLLSLKNGEATNYIKAFEDYLVNRETKILQKESKIKKSSDVPELLYLITLADLHIGNYQNEQYIDSIKESLFGCFKAIKSSGVEKIVLLNTGDMLHTDNSKSQTTSGTQLDSQDSFENAFTNGLDLISEVIDFATELAFSVTFINVRGNHSFDTEYCMGEALKRIYKTCENVEILNSKDTRIYYKWKNNGFLLSHGDRAVERLPLLFATEGKEVFSKTEHHHIILGHLHHNKGKQYLTDRGEYAGIEVRVVGSPTSNDIWHKQNGFCQNKKSIVSMLFSEYQGKYGEFNFKLK